MKAQPLLTKSNEHENVFNYKGIKQILKPLQ